MRSGNGRRRATAPPTSGDRPDGEVGLEAGELRSLRFRCLEGCGHCCLCEPSLRPPEVTFFSEGFPDRIGPSLLDPADTAFRLQGGEGACTFLDGDRRCSVYTQRPFYCQMYPVHITSTWRLQAVANRSCRGLWLEPAGDSGPPQTPLEDVLRAGLASVPPEDALAVLDVTRRQYESLPGWRGPGPGRRALAGALRDGVHTFLDRRADRGRSVPDAAADARRSFGSKRLIEIPIYTDPALRWWVIRTRNDGDGFTGELMDPAGGTTRIAEAGDDAVGAAATGPMTGDAWTLMDSYASQLAARDILIGRAAHEVATGGPGLDSAAVRQMAEAIVGVRYRAALLACLHAGTSDGRPVSVPLGADEIREGIALFDQDLLDRPFLGTML